MKDQDSIQWMTVVGLLRQINAKLETLAAEIPKKEETLFAKDLVVKRTHKSHTRVSYTPERKNFLIDLVLIHKKTIDQVCNFHSVNKSTMSKWISELRSQEAK